MNTLCLFRFKKFYILLSLLITCAFSVDGLAGGETSGGSPKKKFSQLSAQAALESDAFIKDINNTHIEGTSTWLSPMALCLNYQDQVVQTIKRRRTCDLWTVDLRNPEFGRYTAEFESEREAEKKAETANAIGEPYCEENNVAYIYLFEPMNAENIYYRVQFYGRAGHQRGDYLGEHTYKLDECTEDSFDLHFAGGETSGGVTKKKKTSTEL